MYNYIISCLKSLFRIGNEKTPNIIITQKKILKRAIQKSEQPLTKFEREYWAAAIIEELQAAEQHDRLNKLN